VSVAIDRKSSTGASRCIRWKSG